MEIKEIHFNTRIIVYRNPPPPPPPPSQKNYNLPSNPNHILIYKHVSIVCGSSLIMY